MNNRWSNYHNIQNTAEEYEYAARLAQISFT